MKKKYLLVLVCVFVLIYATCFGYGKVTRREVFYQGDRLMVSVDGVEVSSVPSSGNYYLSNYYCNDKNTSVSWDKKNYKLIVSNGNHKGGVSCYLDFESNPKVSSMASGSYVQYVGSNGCVGNSCKGENANYVDSNNLGYCNSNLFPYRYSGWRIAYSKEGSAYLVSGGALECGCTDGNGDYYSNCSSSLNDDYHKHIGNINRAVLKYCNSNYSYNGVCDSSTVRVINDSDFKTIVNKEFNVGGCYELQNKKCGYTNDLIDIGGNYWYGVGDTSLVNYGLYWAGGKRMVRRDVSGVSYGVRPVIKLDSNVIVVGGEGTYQDPYKISNYAFSFGDKANDKVSMKVMGYGVSSMCVNVDSTVCTNYIDFSEDYLLDVSNLDDGKHVVYVYYKNRSGKVLAVVKRELSL